MALYNSKKLETSLKFDPLKSPLLLMQELPTESVFFDRFRADPYLPLFSHQYYKFFLFGLLIFTIK
jgi:hypothetical protein